MKLTYNKIKLNHAITHTFKAPERHTLTCVLTYKDNTFNACKVEFLDRVTLVSFRYEDTLFNEARVTFETTVPNGASGNRLIKDLEALEIVQVPNLPTF